MRTVLVLACILAAAAAAPSEEHIHTRTCHRSNADKTLNSCIRHNIQALLPHVKHGGRFGLPDLEPYHVAEVAFDLRTDLFDFHADMYNMTVHGLLTDTVVRDARAEIGEDSLRLDVDLLMPKNSFRGMLHFTNGQILGLHFNARGLFDFTFDDIMATWRVEAKRRPGEKHMTVESVTPTYTVGHMTTDVKLPGEGLPPNLDRIINAVMNHYWSVMVEMGKPYLQKTLSHHIGSVINTVFQHVPYDDMFAA